MKIMHRRLISPPLMAMVYGACAKSISKEGNKYIKISFADNEDIIFIEESVKGNIRYKLYDPSMFEEEKISELYDKNFESIDSLAEFLLAAQKSDEVKDNAALRKVVKILEGSEAVEFEITHEKKIEMDSLFKMGFVYKDNDELIATLEKLLENLGDDKVQLNSYNHAIGLQGKYRLYDPNCPEGEVKFTNVRDLVEGKYGIRNALNGLGVSIHITGDKENKNKYEKFQGLLDAILKKRQKINGDNQVNLTGPSLETSCHNAAKIGDIHGIKSFIANGGDVNKLDRGDQTATFNAVHNRNVEVTTVLLQEGADEIFNVIRDKNINKLKFLIKCKADVNKIKKIEDPEYDNTIKTPLNAAVDEGDLQMVRILLSAGADVNKFENFNEAGDSVFFTPLGDAVGENNLEIASVLIEAGAVITKDLILEAVLEENVEMVELLLKAGAIVDENIMDDVVKNCNDNVVIELLRAAQRQQQNKKLPETKKKMIFSSESRGTEKESSKNLKNSNSSKTKLSPKN